MSRFDPVLEWKVIGPFPRTTARLFEDSFAIDFARKAVGAGGRGISWQARRAEVSTGRVLLEDLRGDEGGSGFDAGVSPDLAAFAAADLKSDLERPAMLLVGSSGPIVVRVNDRVVMDRRDFSARPYSPNSDLARITLRRGANRFLIQTRQGDAPWSFGVQVSDASGATFAGGSGSAGVEGLRAFALSHSGDARNGETLFLDPKGVGCVRCHSVGDPTRAQLGPDLTGLAAKYDKAEIVRSVLEPSSRIATGYQPLVVARRDGTVATGLLRQETDDHLELIDADGKTIRVPAREIESRKVGDVSMMPAGLADALSPVEFADLISYLMSLKAAR